MPSVRVHFRYCPGLLNSPFRNVRLSGSWDAQGRPAAQWSQTPMQPTLDDDGRSAFDAGIDFDEAAVGTVFHWGVLLDGPLGQDLWGDCHGGGRRGLRLARAILHPGRREPAGRTADGNLLPYPVRPAGRSPRTERSWYPILVVGTECALGRSRLRRSRARLHCR